MLSKIEQWVVKNNLTYLLRWEFVVFNVLLLINLVLLVLMIWSMFND